MKPISEDLGNRIKASALTLCLCWKLSRRDGVELGLTDHDQALEIGGLSYAPGAALDDARFVQSRALKPGHAAAAGALSHQAIREEDLRAGLWDGCRIEVGRCDWQQPELGLIAIWSGYFSEISVAESGRFEADLVSLKADLERPIGRLVQRQCDAVLGDARCGVRSNGSTCDQRFETCRDRFQNTENYRGFPHLPGSDFILAGPAAGRNNGGKR